MKVLTEARDLKRRKARERNEMFVVEGIRATEELLRSPLRSRGALVSDQLALTERGRLLQSALRASGLEVQTVSDRELASAAQTDSPQGVLVLVQTPARTLSDIRITDGCRFLVLDGVQDPGNAGTLVRTAAAFGVDATLALQGTVDLWSGKVVRSAMGTHFTHPALHCQWDDFQRFMHAEGIVLWGAEVGADPPGPVGSIPARLALAVGNEGAGLSLALRAAMVRAVGVRIREAAESLNVAVAAGILLHEICA